MLGPMDLHRKYPSLAANISQANNVYRILPHNAHHMLSRMLTRGLALLSTHPPTSACDQGGLEFDETSASKSILPAVRLSRLACTACGMPAARATLLPASRAELPAGGMRRHSYNMLRLSSSGVIYSRWRRESGSHLKTHITKLLQIGSRQRFWICKTCETRSMCAPKFLTDDIFWSHGAKAKVICGFPKTPPLAESYFVNIY